MMKQLVLLTCWFGLSLGTLTAQQFIPASLSLPNGQTLEGAVDLPNNLKASHLTFKNKAGEVTKYPAQEGMAFTLRLDQAYRFEYRSQMYNPKSGKTWKTQWYYLNQPGYAKLYTEGDRLQFNEKKGTLTIKEKSDGTFTYCLRMGEEATLYPMDQDYKNKALVKMYCKIAAQRFADSPATLALIEQMRSENRYSLAELVSTYNQWYGQQSAR